MRQGRHSRRKGDDWDTEPSRSAERATAIADEERDPSKRSPGRKDKDYCKAARGPHTLATVKPAERATQPCAWRLAWRSRTREWIPGWLCLHREQCAGCGRVVRRLRGEECPDWHPIAVAEQDELNAEVARREEVTREQAKRWPVISGPQGYRRKKAS